MKLKYLLFIFIATLLFSTCNKEEVKNNLPFDIEKNFKINEEYKSDGNALKFKLTDIDDSRCPKDVICVWAGMATVNIAVEEPVSGTIKLNTLNNTIDTLANYSFELLEVLPYPVSTQSIDLEDYIVKLNVKRL